MSYPWPSGPLDAAQRAFDLLICPPAPLTFDGRDIAGLPDRGLALDELRTLLLRPAAPGVLRDAVWRELVVRARRGGPAWVVATVGMALPGLRRVAGLLATGHSGDAGDLDAELLVGFLGRVQTIDLDEPRICGRLIDAGARAARKLRDQDADTHLVHSPADQPHPPRLPWGHPDWVLARAVAAGVLGPQEAHLISATRLGEATLAATAAELGLDASLAGRWRRRAELRLRDAIHAGELEFVRPRARPRRRLLGAPVGSLLGAADAVPVLLGAEPPPLEGKTPVRGRAGVGAPGIVAAPAR